MPIFHDIERKLSRYLLTITIVGGGLGAAVVLLLWAVGMPSAIAFEMPVFFS
ncbi:hypothetical protein [Rhizobium tumorigenes]|uniref:Uncharacterized protein n=1 Tax=Rhizobium tumorigenes TaxID=2041385 RepID=A0AAF1KSA7_9HYPH|nr:hypothetical protein [Rhizobium tumorigenes]WFR97722.1 hypothetical protein PR017_21380 [Rhizobium tumorigenes]